MEIIGVKYFFLYAALQIGVLDLSYLMGQSTVPTESSQPIFEVASVRECRDNDRGGRLSWAAGNLRLPCWGLRDLILEAFDVFQTGSVDPLRSTFPLTPIEGISSWANAARYTIVAKSAHAESGAMMRGPMMQDLLRTRFKLTVKRESRDSPVYFMRLVNGGKLIHTKQGGCKDINPMDGAQDLTIGPGQPPFCVITPPSRDGSFFVWDVKGMSLSILARMIHPNGLQVVDQTGLAGRFDIHLKWAPDFQAVSDLQPKTPPDPPEVDLVTALKQQLGLRLDRGRAPREFLVVTHVEKPSPN